MAYLSFIKSNQENNITSNDLIIHKGRSSYDKRKGKASTQKLVNDG